ncbi:hypothetical protein ABFA07_004542 [Porites harrisoni]
MKFVDPIESESIRERTPSQDAHDSDEEIFEKTTIPAVEVFNMSTVDCQASANSQDDEEAGIIDKAERRRMKFPCPPGPTQAAESNESNKLHNNNCSFQDGGKTTDPRSLLEVLGTVDEKKPGRSSKDGGQQHTSEASTKQTCV